MNCCRPLLRLFSIQNNHQSKKFPSSSRKPSPFLTCESVCAIFLPSTDTQLHKRDSAAMKILVEQPIAAPLANLNVQWNCSWAMTKQTSAVRNGSDSETSSNDPMLLPVTSIINVRYHTLNLILVRTASLSGDRWLQLLELSKSWLWWNPCYNSSAAQCKLQFDPLSGLFPSWMLEYLYYLFLTPTASGWKIYMRNSTFLNDFSHLHQRTVRVTVSHLAIRMILLMMAHFIGSVPQNSELPLMV